MWDGRGFGFGLRIGEEYSPARRGAGGSLEAVGTATSHTIQRQYWFVLSETISLGFSTVLLSKNLYVSCGHLKVFSTSQRYRYDLPVFIIAPRTCSSLRFTILTTTSQGPIALNNLCKGFDRIGKST